MMEMNNGIDYKQVQFKKVNLKDDDINKVYSIEVVSLDTSSNNVFVEVFPIRY
jgi:hypothetical protein